MLKSCVSFALPEPRGFDHLQVKEGVLRGWAGRGSFFPCGAEHSSRMVIFSNISLIIIHIWPYHLKQGWNHQDKNLLALFHNVEAEVCSASTGLPQLILWLGWFMAFLSDSGPIIVYACHSLTHWLTNLLKLEWIDHHWFNRMHIKRWWWCWLQNMQARTNWPRKVRELILNSGPWSQGVKGWA